MDLPPNPEKHECNTRIPLEEHRRIMKLEPSIGLIAYTAYTNALDMLAAARNTDSQPETTAQREVIYSD